MNRLLKVFLAVGVFAFSAQVVEPSPLFLKTTFQGSKGSEKVMREFHGLKLGMKRDAVLAAAGKPENSSDNSDDFKLTGDDTMTVHYDNGEVKAIQIAFLDAKNAPAWNDVVGDAEVNELANGAKTSRKTMTDEKFWVSIYKSQDGSIIRITISRL